MSQSMASDEDFKRFEGGSAIAVIGIGCLFPDAAHLEQYWENIQQGKDSIGPIPLTHWKPADYYDADPKKADHTYAQSGGFLQPYAFDPMQFGLAPHALEATDSTQLLGMVAAHQAMVDAGYGPGRSFDRERVSCLLGITGTLELVVPLGARLGHPLWKKALDKAGVAPEVAAAVMEEIAASYVPWQENSFPGLLGNVVAGRIANRLDIGGSNSVVDAACASSLAALHMAMMELEAGKTDMVITGGMDTFNDIFMYMCFSKTPALSPSGQARPFDAEGDGTILGEGLGALVLKRLDHALRDGDRVYAVIRGMGSSSDGKGQAIYAPSAKGQVKALTRAYANAGVEPRSIGLLEAHGTGTKVGDGVELDALRQVYGSAAEEGAWCTLGSVKSQIGHTKAAAGAAGLIKAVMALHHKVLPPTLKVKQPHPRLAGSPFALSTQARPWISGDQPRRAAVSAFGFGGSNYHCVLEELGPRKNHVTWDPDLLVGLFSAATPAQLLAQLRASRSDIESGHEARIVLRRARAAFKPDDQLRLGLTARGRQSFIDRLDGALAALDKGLSPDAPGVSYVSASVDKAQKLALVFAGQGSQTVGMMSDLACRFPEMLEAIERSEAFLAAREGRSLQKIIYPAEAFSPEEASAQNQTLTETRYAQLALATVGIGALRILKRFGVEGEVFAGHSFGELLALYAAGVWQEEDLLLAAYERGRLMSERATPGGALLAVLSSYDKVWPLIEASGLDLHPANYNAPQQVVLGGDRRVLLDAQQQLKAAGIDARMLEVSAAFHTPWVSAAVEPFAAVLETIEFHPAQKAVYANCSAAPYAADAREMRADLARQIDRPVRFGEMIARMQSDGVSHFVEVGPTRKLKGLLKANTQQDALGFAGDLGGLARLLVDLSLCGHRVDWSAWDPGTLVSEARSQRFQVMISGANYRNPTPPSSVLKPGGSSKQVGEAPQVVFDKSAPHERDAARLEKPARPSSALASGPASAAPASGLASRINVAPVSGFANQAASASGLASRVDAAPASGFANQAASASGLASRVNAASASGLANQAASASGSTSRAGAAPEHALPSPPSRQAPASSSPLSTSSTPHSHEVSMSPKLPEDLQRLDQLLRDMQDMQRRTTEAHTLFLENQRQFQSMLRQVLVQDQLGQGSPLAEDAPAVRPAAPAPAPYAAPPAPARRVESANPRPTHAESSPAARLPPQPEVPSSSSRPEAPPAAAPLLSQQRPRTVTTPAAAPLPVQTLDQEQKVFALIAQSTGYPAAMLEAGMDLEGDLGIDSIKKVEIYAALQESFPHMQSDPQQMAETRTIAELLQLIGTSDRASPAAASERVGAWSAGQVLLAHAAPAPKKQAQLLDLIAEKTGFPAAMLQSELDLESDLGIDSIKKVEIFSALQEGFPELNGLGAERMQEVRTIGDLEALFQNEKPEDAADADPHASHELVARQDHEELIFQVIADKTGYPRSVIASEMDLEADLGIDSIKRVEILSALSEQIPSLQGVEAETLAKARTVGDFLLASRGKGDENLAAALLDPALVEHWDLSGKKKESSPTDEAVSPAAAEGQPAAEPEPVEAAPTIEVLRLRAEPFASTEMARSYAKDQEYWIADDGSNLARNMMLKLQERGVQTRLVSLAMQDRWNVPENLGGLFLIAPLKFDALPLRWLGQAFALLRKVGPQLVKNSSQSLFVTISRHGGRFGLDGLQQIAQAYAGGMGALAKTVEKEWTGVHARALDLGKDFADGFEAALRVLEAATLSGPVEIGVTRDQYYRLISEAESWQETPASPCLQKGDAVLVTGGARGVTAAALRSLAQRYQPHFIIWGRSALTVAAEKDLPEESASASLKQLLLARYPELKHPRELERVYQSVLAARELKANIKSLEELGAQVTYEAVDVSKESELRTAFEQLDARFGVPRAVIHGAGVLRDRLLLELKDEDFALVLDTKLKILPFLEDLARKGVPWMSFFSSSTARYGRRGQGAYALANEVLNKSAHVFQSHGTRTLSLNWGPWDGGMVQEGLKKLFAAEGVATIPLEAGAELLRDLLEHPQLGSGEWVVLASPARESARVQVLEAETDQALASWEVSLAATPILIDHVLKYRAVTPAALFLEWMSVSAQKLHPQATLQRIENFQVWKGLTLGAQETARVESWLVVKPADEDHHGGRGGTEIRLQSQTQDARPYAHARFIFGAAPELAPPHYTLSYPTDGGIESSELYENILFHGDGLQFIQEIAACDSQGLWARLQLAGEPSDWAKEGLGAQWLSQAPLIDAVFQSAIVWSQMQRGLRCLPQRIERLAFYAPLATDARLRLRLELAAEQGARLSMRAQVYDEQGKCLAALEGVEMTMDAGLSLPFAQNRLSRESPSAASPSV